MESIETKLSDKQDYRQTIWSERHTALQAAIASDRELVAGPPAASGTPSTASNGFARRQLNTGASQSAEPLYEIDPRTRAIATKLLDGLSQFLAGQFNFFYSRLGNVLLLPPEGQRHESALTEVLFQASADLAAIHQAISQRATLSGDNVPESVRRLELADYLGNLMLDSVKHLFPPNETPVALTYFNKSSMIRVIPYASVALIGIPYSAASTNRDLFAVPHEVGHYVYWNAKLSEGVDTPDRRRRFYYELPQGFRAKNLPMWMCNWAEETFADVFGAAVSGPTVALDFQDLALEGYNHESIVKDDGKHPSPVLRPPLYLHILGKYIAADLENADTWRKLKERLTERWNKMLGEGFPDANRLRPRDLSDLSISQSVGDLMEEAADLPYLMLAINNASPLVREWSATRAVMDEIANHAGEPERLYDDWDDRVRELIFAQDKLAQVGQFRPHLIDVNEEPTIKLTAWEQLRDEFVAEADYAQRPHSGATAIRAVNSDDLTWFAVRLAGGWSEGPTETQPPH